jgi:hypothetical protein
MTLAAGSSSYPLLNVFWTMFEFFLWVAWIWILIAVFIDIFRSPDLSGWDKALWFLFVLLIPLVGVLVYLIARGGKMHERSARQAQHEDEAFRGYVQSAAANSPLALRTSLPSSLTSATREHHQRGVRTREGEDSRLKQTRNVCSKLTLRR